MPREKQKRSIDISAVGIASSRVVNIPVNIKGNMSDSFAIDSHKMQYHSGRVGAWSGGQGSSVYPIYVEISPVGHCNHRCTFCAVDYIGYKTRSLDSRKLMEAIGEMAEGGVKSIMFAGEGEPMLHPEISLLVTYTRLCGIDVAFTTNATAMTESFVKKCLGAVSWIKVSCNAGTPELYSKIHQCDIKHWEKIWKNILFAVSERNALGLKTVIGVQCLLLPENASSLEALARQCKNIGVDYLVIKPYSHNPNSITQTYRDIEYRDYYNDVLKGLEKFVSSKFEIVTRANAIDAWDSENRGYSTCHSTPYFWAYLMASGDLYACSAHIGDESFNLGNINDTNFHDIWQGEVRKKLIEKMKNFDISTCRKNCRMNSVNKYLWDLKNPNPHKNFI